LLDKYPFKGSYEVYLSLAQSFIKLNEYYNAMVQFQLLMDRYPESRKQAELNYSLGLAAFSLGRDQLAWESLQSITEDALSPAERINVHLMLADLADAKEDYWLAWTKLMQAWEKMRQSPHLKVMKTAEEIQESISGLIANKLNREQLMAIKEQYPESFPGGEAILRLAQIASEALEYDQAQTLLTEFLTEFADHPRHQEAQELSQKITRARLTDRNRIGLIVPLSGELSVYGNMVLKGVELAVEEENREREVKISLIIKDSQGKAEQAAKAVQQLITEERVIGIIGPVLSKSAKASGELANRLHTPMITPTASAQGIPELGPYVFRNCITSTQVARSIAQFAIDKMCLKEFAVLYPKNSYGIEFKNIFCAYVDLLGGKVLGLATYEEGETDFRWQAEYLSSIEPEAIFIPDYADKVVLIAPQLAFYTTQKPPEELPPDVVLDEGESKLEKERQQQLLAAELKKETASEWWLETGGIEALPPAIPPQTRNPLEAETTRATEPPAADTTTVVLLGTNGWHSPQLVKEGGKFVERAVFPVGFYDDSPSPAVQGFISRFRQRFWQPPNLLAAQAYDATQMVIQALREGSANRDDLRQALLSMRDFAGVSGLTSFTADGDSQKELFIIGVKDGRLRQLKGDEEWLCPTATGLRHD
jgi:ABC-type branched-subunit amino acid transport system substrate-binding protein